MKPRSPLQRLIIAAAVAVAAQWLLSWLFAQVPGISTLEWQSRAGVLQAAPLLATLVAMGLGGWMAGYRFVGVAVVINLLLWLMTLLVLARLNATLEQGTLPHHLVRALRFNLPGILGGVAVAALGAATGAWLRQRRVASRLPASPP